MSLLDITKMWPDERSRQEKTVKEQKKGRVLDYVNALRAEFFAPPLTELPKGMTGSPRGCVIARAIEEGGTQVYASVTGDQICMYGKGYVGSPKTPDHIREFIGAFDAFQYPELVAA